MDVKLMMMMMMMMICSRHQVSVSVAQLIRRLPQGLLFESITCNNNNNMCLQKESEFQVRSQLTPSNFL